MRLGSETKRRKEGRKKRSWSPGWQRGGKKVDEIAGRKRLDLAEGGGKSRQRAKEETGRLARFKSLFLMEKGCPGMPAGKRVQNFPDPRTQHGGKKLQSGKKEGRWVSTDSMPE